MKQKIIFTLLSIFTLLGLQAQEEKALNKKNEAGQKIGKWSGYFSDGRVRYIGQFEMDIPVDTFFYFYPDGKLQTLMIHLGNNLAYAKMYYSTGEIMAEGRYRNQKKDSVWQTYGAGGVLVSKGGYISDAKTGLWLTFFADGTPAEKVTYKNDIEVGEYRKFHDNGKVWEESQYENGFLEGLTTFYDKEGNKILKGIYKKGLRSGTWIYYNSNGTVDKKVEYVNGKPVNKEGEIIIIPEGAEENRKDYLEFEDIREGIKYDNKQ